MIIFVEKFSLSVEAEKMLRESLRREQELAAREREVAAKELATEQHETAIAKQEAADQKERADKWEANFKQVTKKPGIGCVLKKIFTLGLTSCL